MTFSPPPYVTPVRPGDPTDVMGRRILAHLVDIAVVGVIAALLFLATAKKLTDVPSDYCTANHSGRSYSCVNIGTTAYETSGGTTLLFAGTALGYWIIVGMVEGATGAFLGKRMAGLRVVRRDGGLAGAGKGALRGFLMIIDSMLCFVIGLIVASVTHPHRRIGDMAADTFVVGKESVGHPVVPMGFHNAPPPYRAAGAPPVQQPPLGSPTPQVTDPTEPHWDEARNAWIAWEPTRGIWMQFDAAVNEWRPM